jgi:hypothetical protein
VVEARFEEVSKKKKRKQKVGKKGKKRKKRVLFFVKKVERSFERRKE